MTQPTITLPLWATGIVSREGYMARYYLHRANGMKSREAYEQVESELEQYFNTNRYTSFASFQVSMQRWREMQKQKST